MGRNSRQNDVTGNGPNDIAHNERCLDIVELVLVEVQVFLPSLESANFP